MKIDKAMKEKDKEKILEDLSEEIENELILIGCTAVEDKL